MRNPLSSRSHGILYDWFNLVGRETFQLTAVEAVDKELTNTMLLSTGLMNFDKHIASI